MFDARDFLHSLACGPSSALIETHEVMRLAKHLRMLPDGELAAMLTTAKGLYRKAIYSEQSRRRAFGISVAAPRGLSGMLAEEREEMLI